ncbi:hypothetical protein BH20ACT5_BH20ACT5_08830 [soil metagenome]
MPDPPFEPEPMLAALQRHEMEFVLIGGMAAIFHGSPLLTQDIDITPARNRENLTRLSAALTELDAKVRAVELDEALPFSHDADSLAAVQVWNLSTPYGDLDISFVPTGTTGYDDLRRDAGRVDFRGLQIWVASLADVIRSKEAAGRDKDRRALPVLREILARRLHEQ